MSAREIIHLHLGQAGSQIGGSLWNTYCNEYKVERSGKYNGQNPTNISHIFKNVGESYYKPRAVFFDLDPETKQTFRDTSLKRLFGEDQFITGREDASNNFARGFYNLGREFRDEMIDGIRRESEACDSLQGFYIFRSLGGGTGSGVGSLLIQELQHEFGGKDKMDFSIAPSSVLNTSVTEPYNVVHSMYNNIEDNDISVMMDNKALYSVSANKLDIEVPRYRDLNRLVSRVVQSVTSTLGAGAGANRMTLSEFKTNLIPFSRIHHTIPSYAPLSTNSRSHYHRMSVTEITRSAFDEESTFLSVGDMKDSKFLSSCLLYRGDVSRREANQAKNTILDEYQFVDWAPNGIKLNIQNRGYTKSTPSKSVTMLGINTALKDSLYAMNTRFDMMLQKRAFMHWYLMEGMEELEFHDAKEELFALEKDYNELHNDDDSYTRPLKSQGYSVYEY
ncbi:Tubulin alpha-1C chain [Oopsacas minuta]|uniref:Tubulin alpha chain n=1 Tax=Oopsacas minuta TaxID=111878 RepID=A0AAV7KEN9_9METZ|nr:Tubulin alpha-1C chain [Oopsacas minuta]